jgi:putative DNA primase/helicase
MRIDTTQLLADADIVTVIDRHVPLKKKGAEHLGVCPFHDDTKASLHVNRTKQVYGCFACGAGGDAIDFLMRLGQTFHEACNEIAGGDVNAPKAIEKRKAKEATKAVIWKQVQPEIARWANEIKHYRHGNPSRVWEYKSAEGNPLGYICRFELPDGTKEVLPYIYATDGVRKEWRWQGFDQPRPLYNLDQLTARPDAAVLVVEGEKTADAAQALLPAYVVTCWQGGANAITKTNWEPLQGRKVLVWPDNDYTHRYGTKHTKKGKLKPFHEQPGNHAMLEIADILKPMGAAIRWIGNPEGTPCGWDVADADWNTDQAKAHIKTHLQAVPVRPEPGFEQEQDEPEKAPPPPPPPVLPPVDDTDEDEAQPFRVLGYSKDGDGTKYHFFGYQSGTVISMSPGGISKNNLLQLAPLNYWEHAGMGNGNGKLKNELIANMLIEKCIRKGIFSDKNIRGRGAWVEINGTVVLHNGDRLVVNGKTASLKAHKSRFIYESSEPLGFNTHDPLPPSESSKLIEVLKLLNWDRDVNAYLLAGWCVVAPICGALSWRPHVWLTGAAGTGKSWVFKNIVRRLLSETAVAVQGETTEPGLRQTLGHDALPVVFDEAEGEDRRAQDRMQSVLALMRAASADDGGIMAKGTAGGSAKTYRIRSCFAFASIAYQVAQQSDRTRVTVLGLSRATDQKRDERWQKLQQQYHELITNEWVRRLQARTVSLIPVILENARTFSTAAAMVIGEQRAGDQLGALLAGAYSLHSGKRISLEDAKAWVEARKWDEERGLNVSRDEFALLSYLLEQTITIENRSGRWEHTIAEAVSIVCGHYAVNDVTPEAAMIKLKRCGFKVDGEFLAISNSADWILKKLEGKQWAKNHNKILRRIDGAKDLPSMRFGPGLATRAVGVPLALLWENP